MPKIDNFAGKDALPKVPTDNLRRIRQSSQANLIIPKE